MIEIRADGCLVRVAGVVGYQHENNRAQIRFPLDDVLDIVRDNPGGSYAVVYKRMFDEQFFTSTDYELDGAYLIWNVSSHVVAVRGELEVQIVYSTDQQIAETQTFHFKVARGLMESEEGQGENLSDLIEQALLAAGTVDQAIYDAQQTLDEKVTAAQAAQTAAEEAQGAAETAQAAAEQAQSLAQNNESAAEMAARTATTACQNAVTAKNEAVNAKIAAVAARAAAEAAEGNAEASELRAEGFAVGTQNGTPAGSGEPYYQDNAKYYKEQAEAAKTAAEAARDTAQQTVAGVETAGTAQVQRVTAEGATQVGNVQTKGQQVLDSIPDDYSELSAEVGDLKSALNALEPDATSADIGKTLIAKTVENGKVTEYEFGAAVTIDDTLTQANEAADAKATGDALENLEDIIVNGVISPVTPTSIDKLYIADNGEIFYTANGYVTQYIPVTANRDAVLSIKTLRSLEVHYAFSVSIPAALGPATFLKKSTVANTETYSYSPVSDGYLSVAYYGAFMDSVSATVVADSLSEKINNNEIETNAIKSDLNAITTAQDSDIGKLLKVKTVSNNKVTEWEFDGAITESDFSIDKFNLYDTSNNIAGTYIDGSGEIKSNANCIRCKIPVFYGETLEICRVGYASYGSVTGLMLVCADDDTVLASIDMSNYATIYYGEILAVRYTINSQNAAYITFNVKTATWNSSSNVIATNRNINTDLNGDYIKEINGLPIESVNGGSTNKKWEGKTWVVIGDSITAVNSRATKRYFDYVKDETGISVVNMGVSGTGYKTAGSGTTPFYTRALNVPATADVVTIFGSFNDGLTDLGDADDTGTTTIAGCINTTLDNLYSVNPLMQVGIVSPTPWVSMNPYDHSTANAYVELLESICKRRSVPFLNLYYESSLRPWESAFRAVAYTHDDGNGVHPDENGHKLIAGRFYALLDSLIT